MPSVPFPCLSVRVYAQGDKSHNCELDFCVNRCCLQFCMYKRSSLYMFNCPHHCEAWTDSHGLAPAICHFSLVVTYEVDHSYWASFAKWMWLGILALRSKLLSRGGQLLELQIFIIAISILLLCFIFYYCIALFYYKQLYSLLGMRLYAHVMCTTVRCAIRSWYSTVQCSIV